MGRCTETDVNAENPEDDSNATTVERDSSRMVEKDASVIEKVIQEDQDEHTVEL